MYISFFVFQQKDGDGGKRKKLKSSAQKPEQWKDCIFRFWTETVLTVQKLQICLSLRMKIVISQPNDYSNVHKYWDA